MNRGNSAPGDPASACRDSHGVGVFMMASSTGGSNLPRPSKSRLPVSVLTTGPRLAGPHDQPTAVVNLSPRRAAAPSAPRVPKSPVARPHTISIDSKPSQSFSVQVPPSGSERPRTKSVPKSPSRFRSKESEQVTPSKAPAMSMKAAIALKRAETRKATIAQRASSEQGGSNGSGSIEETSPNAWGNYAVDGDDLGRLSIRETIERARSSGV